MQLLLFAPEPNALEKENNNNMYLDFEIRFQFLFAIQFNFFFTTISKTNKEIDKFISMVSHICIIFQRVFEKL